MRASRANHGLFNPDGTFSLLRRVGHCSHLFSSTDNSGRSFAQHQLARVLGNGVCNFFSRRFVVSAPAEHTTDRSSINLQFVRQLLPIQLQRAKKHVNLEYGFG